MTMYPFSPLALLNALAACGGTEPRCVAYGETPRHRVDIYAPKQARGKMTSIVFFYGGGWESGDKALYGFVGHALAALGYLVFIPNYRVYPQVRFPAFVEDGARAVAFARHHAGAYGGDPARIVLMGHSAGAHIAALLALDARWLSALGLAPDRDLLGMVGLAGPYDFLPLHSATLQEIFRPAAALAETQPITFANSDAPPFFLATTSQDSVVAPGNSHRLAQAIREKGGSATVKVYRRLGHRSLIGVLASPLRWVAPVLRDIVAFIDTLPQQGNAKPCRAMAWDSSI